MRLAMTSALDLMLMLMMAMGRAEIAASSVGSGFYEACLAFHTTTNKVCVHEHNYNMTTIQTILVAMITTLKGI